MYGEVAKAAPFGGAVGGGASIAPSSPPMMETVHAVLNEIDEIIDGTVSRTRTLAGDFASDTPDNLPEPAGVVDAALLRLQRMRNRLIALNQQLNKVV